MNETKRNYGLLSETSTISETRSARWQRNLPATAGFGWLRSGWRDLATQPGVGINTEHSESRLAQMPAFGRTGMLDYAQIDSTAAYVYALSNPGFVTAENRQDVVLGREVFEANCAVCHGPTGHGDPEIGAPDLTDRFWIYSGELSNIVRAIHDGRQGHMPTWDERLSEVEIKILALYVHALGQEGQRNGP